MVTVMPTKHPHKKPNNTFIFALGRRSTRNCPEHAGKLVFFCLVSPRPQYGKMDSFVNSVLMIMLHTSGAKISSCR